MGWNATGGGWLVGHGTLLHPTKIKAAYIIIG